MQRLLREALTLAKGLAAPEAVREDGGAYETRSPSRFSFGKYPYTRFWSVEEDGKLLGVVVYRKGAEAIQHRLQAQEDRIQALETRVAEFTQDPPDQALESTLRPGAVERLRTEQAAAGGRGR